VSVICALSVEDLTSRAAWIAGLGVLALLLTGWRKTVRAQPRASRATWTRPRDEVAVVHEPVDRYRRPGPLRRVLAAGASGVLAVVTGAVLAILIAFTVSFAVVTLTDLLKR
jgi:hypothetical protein